ncbi:macrophage mannose receptor 1-like [Hippoglossus hippoglossus]|uniref:macrophage mannose receptor 1-like n=1 Tax=Hippoglossus hippoglossus TaxID=8267 RepID=UPI00148E6702|nr:macrophage mannose receptor 1-like [Hippoglossus hippoglossus]
MQWSLLLLILMGQCYFVMCVDHEDNMTLIKEEKTWQEALDHCRENHHDLVSITNQTQQEWVQKKVENAKTEFIWLGLRYTCTLGTWFWVNGEILSYDNWKSTQSHNCDSAAAMQKDKPHTWVETMANQTFNFICVD